MLCRKVLAANNEAFLATIAAPPPLLNIVGQSLESPVDTRHLCNIYRGQVNVLNTGFRGHFYHFDTNSMEVNAILQGFFSREI
eukprot:SAG31_NODE_4474_length_3203_cov_1.555412_3_plen_83_part_00